MSSAGWCCGRGDGNAWFGDTHFDIKKWQRALAFMADHVSQKTFKSTPSMPQFTHLPSQGKSWPTFISIGLRNELRPTSTRAARPVNWNTWYGNMTTAASAVQEANPNLLIFFSGLHYDSQLRPLFTSGEPRDTIDFNPSKFPYGNKIVLEVHDYDLDEKNCTNKRAKLTKNSFGALGPKSNVTTNVFPLVMSEWGFAQSPDQYNAPFAACLGEFLPEMRVGWMIWVLVGRYYTRQGEQAFDETWGLLDKMGRGGGVRSVLRMGLCRWLGRRWG